MVVKKKEITTPEYWNKIYTGNNVDAKLDASNQVRAADAFDRFQIVVDHAEGKRIIGVGSGHARIEERIKAKFPDSEVIASDQAWEALKVAHYRPYIVADAYKLPYTNNYFDLLIITQALEYIDDQDAFFTEAKRVASKLLCTVPKGQMSTWSQLRVYDITYFKTLLTKHGTIEVFEDWGHIMLAKIKFH